MRAVVLFSVAVCSALFPAAARADTALHRAVREVPVTLDPQKATSPAENAIVGDLFEGLLTLDGSGRPVLGLADSWSADAAGTRYTFHLRPGLAWSDGSPLTAADVVASFRRLMDPATAAPEEQAMEIITNGHAVATGALPPEKLGVSAEADTVVIDLAAPAPYLPGLLAQPFAAVTPVSTIAREGVGWIKPGVLISDGAFVLSSWPRGDRVVLVRNPRYHDASDVRFDQIIYDAVGANGLERFHTGEFDTLAGLSPDEAAAARDAPELHLDPALLTYYLAANTTRKPLSAQPLRRALSLAIDRVLLTNKVLRGGEQPALSLVPPATANHTPSPVDFAEWPMPERLAEARRLLGEAGYAEAHPLRVTLVYSADPELERLCVMLAALWKPIGVETTVQAADAKAYDARLGRGDFDLAVMGWSADFDDASDFLSLLASTNTKTNTSRYANPDFDELLARAAATADGTARAALLHQAEAVAMAAQPVIPLYFGANRNLIAGRVADWRSNPVDAHPSRTLSLQPAPPRSEKRPEAGAHP